MVRSAILSAIRSAAPLRTDTPSRHRCRSAPRVARLGGQTSSTAVDASDDRGRPRPPKSARYPVGVVSPVGVPGFLGPPVPGPAQPAMPTAGLPALSRPESPRAVTGRADREPRDRAARLMRPDPRGTRNGTSRGPYPRAAHVITRPRARRAERCAKLSTGHPCKIQRRSGRTTTHSQPTPEKSLEKRPSATMRRRIQRNTNVWTLICHGYIF